MNKQFNLSVTTIQDRTFKSLGNVKAGYHAVLCLLCKMLQHTNIALAAQNLV